MGCSSIKMFLSLFYVLFAFCAVFHRCSCQQYDFAAEMTRQCLVPDPVGLVDCVEEKVTLPYLTSWVECTNSLGENVRTSADVVNYRCKSVWEGKGLIPEVFFLKDCVIEKTGLPAKNVSAEVLGAYKECENSPSSPQQRIKTAPVQQQQLSSVEYNLPRQPVPAPVIAPQQIQAPIVNPSPQQFQAPVFTPPRQQMQLPIQQSQTPQQFQSPVANLPRQQMQMPIQQTRAPLSFQPQNIAPRQQFQPPAARQVQNQQPAIIQRPVQQQIKAPVFHPVQQVQTMQSGLNSARPPQLTKQQVSVASNPSLPSTVPRPQYARMMPAYVNTAAPRQPVSQQFFAMYPQPPVSHQQHVNPIMTQKTAPNSFLSQQQISASTQQISSINPNAPYSYSFQITHPLRQAI